MGMTDPISDMLTRIRNASSAGHEKVIMPLSNIKARLAEVLKSEGFIKDYILHKDAIQGSMTVVLRYGQNKEPAITGVKRFSRPGLRRYPYCLTQQSLQLHRRQWRQFGAVQR